MKIGLEQLLMLRDAAVGSLYVKEDPTKPIFCYTFKARKQLVEDIESIIRAESVEVIAEEDREEEDDEVRA